MTYREHFSWLKLDEEAHRYTDETGQEYLSVSKFIDKFIPDTFTDAFVQKYAKDKGLDPNFVKTKWAIARDYSAVKGTEFHLFVETLLKEGLEIETITPIHREIEMFKDYWRIQKKLVTVVDQELRIASRKYKISGTIDCLCQDKETGFYLILDWKTNKNIRMSGFKGAKLLPPFDKHDNCEYNKYSMQQTLYRMIMEDEFDIKFKETRIVHFAPDKSAADPMVLYDMNDPMRVALEQHLNVKST